MTPDFFELSVLTNEGKCAIILAGDSMFNEEIKQRFLESGVSASCVKNSRAVFVKSEPVETQIGRDIAQFDKADAAGLLDVLDIEELSVIYQYRFSMNKYLEWCKGARVFDEVKSGFLEAIGTDLDISGKVSRFAFRDAEDLVRSMRKARELSEGYAAPVAFSLAWCGLLRPEILSVQDRDIDFEKSTVCGNSVQPEIISVLEEFSRTRSGSRENNAGAYTVYKDYSVDGFLKPFHTKNSTKYGEPYTGRKLENMMSDFNLRYIDLGYPARFTFDNVWKSGRHYALWEMENAGFDVNAKENESKILELFRNKKGIAAILWYHKAYKKAFNL